MWAHSSHSPDRYSHNWEGELWAVPGVVPLLVLELALLQLRSSLEVGSRDSLALAEAEQSPRTVLLEDEDVRP